MRDGIGESHVGIPSGTPESVLDSSRIRNEYFANPSEARLIISQLPPESLLDIEITVAEFNKFHIELAQNIATDLASVGFNVSLRPIHPSHYSEILIDPVKNYQMIIIYRDLSFSLFQMERVLGSTVYRIMPTVPLRLPVLIMLAW